MSKQIIAIWAEARNHVIGKNHTMPWHLPAELAHFKKTTMGSAILMGRVTFDGWNRRCLPGRETLFLTRDKDFDCEEVTTVTSVEEALAWFEQQDKDLYIAGGAGVYQYPYHGVLRGSGHCGHHCGEHSGSDSGYPSRRGPGR